jgi:uncharacterized protein YmfQ (DUF2313 family)
VNTIKKLFATDQQVDLMDILLSILPQYYHQNYDAMEIWRTGNRELALNANQIYEVLNQLFIEEATWGLSAWETMLGLPNGISLSYEERRGNIKAKLRSNSVVTKARLLEIANSYKQGTIQVTEKVSNFEIEIKFVSIYGIPSNVQDFQKAIREIIPAHLNVTYIFNYTTMGELTSYDMSMGQISLMNMTMAQWAVYRD